MRRYGEETAVRHTSGALSIILTYPARLGRSQSHGFPQDAFALVGAVRRAKGTGVSGITPRRWRTGRGGNSDGEGLR